MSSDTIISKATRVCLQRFTNCLEVEELLKDEWAENRLADFSLWISGTGALAGGRASLDHRLRAKPEARAVIANLLLLLADIVDKCKISSDTAISETIDDNDSGRDSTTSPESLPGRPFSPWSDESMSDDSVSDGQLEEQPEPPFSNNPLRENMQSIEAILGQLAQIAISVRQSGKRSRLQKADHLFRPEDYEDLKDHLSTIILTRAEFSEQQLDPLNLDEIQRRLIYCNLKRRNRFVYAQRHSQRLNPVMPAPTFQAPTIQAPKIQASTIRARAVEIPDANLEEEQKSESPSSASKTPSKTPNASINHTIRTGTSASAISESFVLPQAPLPATALSTILSSTAIDLKYPPPPVIKDGAHVFVCPCCCQTLPVSVLVGNRWKKHIADDLCPYTCILSNCNEPTRLFTTTKLWRLHLGEGHYNSTYWICFSCNDNIQFQTEKAFADHIKEQHAAIIPYDQISLLTDISKRSAPLEITSCPLCDWPEKEGEGVHVDKDALLDHIAKELHSFSLRSLPWADSNGQETDERIRYSSDKVYDWLIANDLCRSPKIERPPLEGRTFTSEYFQQNPYFAAKSASSDSSIRESLNSREKDLRNWKQEDSNESKDISKGFIESLEKPDDESIKWKAGTVESSSGVELKLEDEIPADDDHLELRTGDRLNLILAAKAGDVAMVEKLLNEGSEIEATDEDGCTSLLWAAREGKTDAVKLLLKRGAGIETKDMDDRTPLLSACHTGMDIAAKVLIEHGADVNATDKHGWTPLFWATHREKEAVAELLLASGADITAKDTKGWTPLLVAAYNGHEDIARFLISNGANIEAKDTDGWTSLLLAVYSGHEAIARLLIESGADTDARNNENLTPLLHAASNGREAIVKLLLESGADTDARHKTSFTPLLYATSGKSEAIVKLLLKHGANIEAKDEYGRTSLLWAVCDGREAMVKLLLESDADIEANDIDGLTPLLYAAYSKSEAIPVVKLLLKHGANIEARDIYWQRTPLIVAARDGKEAIVKLLLENGANTEATDGKGSTSLLYAASCKSEAIVKLLLEHGANIKAKDCHGRTPLQRAERGERKNMIELFLKSSAARQN